MVGKSGFYANMIIVVVGRLIRLRGYVGKHIYREAHRRPCKGSTWGNVGMCRVTHTFLIGWLGIFCERIILLHLLH